MHKDEPELTIHQVSHEEENRHYVKAYYRSQQYDKNQRSHRVRALAVLRWYQPTVVLRGRAECLIHYGN